MARASKPYTKVDVISAMANVILRAMNNLVEHDVAQDKRENLPHCIELQEAIHVLEIYGVRARE